MATHVFQCTRCKTDLKLPVGVKAFVCGGCQQQYQLSSSVQNPPQPASQYPGAALPQQPQQTQYSLPLSRGAQPQPQPQPVFGTILIDIPTTHSDGETAYFHVESQFFPTGERASTQARFSQFLEMNETLREWYRVQHKERLNSLPAFPPKRSFTNHRTPEFVDTRRNELRTWLRAVLSDPTSLSCDALLQFLGFRNPLWPWNCPACTLANVGVRTTQCAACGTARPAGAPAAPAPEPPPPASAASGAGSKPAAVSSQAMPQPPPPPVSSPAPKIADIGTAAGQWSCAHCTMNNPASSNLCSMCHIRNTAPASAPSSVSQPPLSSGLTMASAPSLPAVTSTYPMPSTSSRTMEEEMKRNSMGDAALPSRVTSVPVQSMAYDSSPLQQPIRASTTMPSAAGSASSYDIDWTKNKIRELMTARNTASAQPPSPAQAAALAAIDNELRSLSSIVTSMRTKTVPSPSTDPAMPAAKSGPYDTSTNIRDGGFQSGATPFQGAFATTFQQPQQQQQQQQPQLRPPQQSQQQQNNNSAMPSSLANSRSSSFDSPYGAQPRAYSDDRFANTSTMEMDPRLTPADARLQQFINQIPEPADAPPHQYTGFERSRASSLAYTSGQQAVSAPALSQQQPGAWQTQAQPDPFRGHSPPPPHPSYPAEYQSPYAQAIQIPSSTQSHVPQLAAPQPLYQSPAPTPLLSSAVPSLPSQPWQHQQVQQQHPQLQHQQQHQQQQSPLQPQQLQQQQAPPPFHPPPVQSQYSQQAGQQAGNLSAAQQPMQPSPASSPLPPLAPASPAVHPPPASLVQPPAASAAPVPAADIMIPAPLSTSQYLHVGQQPPPYPTSPASLARAAEATSAVASMQLQPLSTENAAASTAKSPEPFSPQGEPSVPVQPSTSQPVPMTPSSSAISTKSTSTEAAAAVPASAIAPAANAESETVQTLRRDLSEQRVAHLERLVTDAGRRESQLEQQLADAARREAQLSAHLENALKALATCQQQLVSCQEQLNVKFSAVERLIACLGAFAQPGLVARTELCAAPEIAPAAASEFSQQQAQSDSDPLSSTSSSAELAECAPLALASASDSSPADDAELRSATEHLSSSSTDADAGLAAACAAPAGLPADDASGASQEESEEPVESQ